MGIFDAQVDASITPVRPIADETAGGGASVAGGALSALGDLLGGIAGSRGGGGDEASFTERQDALNTAIRAQLTEDLQTANALRADGREQEARDLTRGIIAEATARGVDPSQSWFQETFTAATGMQYEDVVTDPRARAQRALLDSEQGQRLMAIEIARGSSEVDAENSVLSRIAQMEAAAQTVADRNIAWASGGREAVFTLLDTTFDNGVGGLMLHIQQTGYVPSSDEVAFLRHEIDTLSTSLQRYRSGAGEEWQDVQNTLDGFNRTLELVEGLSGAERIEAAHLEAMVFELQRMHEEGELSSGGFSVALGMLRDPEGWQAMENDQEATSALRGAVVDPRVTTADMAAATDPDLGGTVDPETGETLAPVRRGPNGEIVIGSGVWSGTEETRRAFEGRSSEELVQEAIAASSFTSAGTPSQDDLSERSRVMSALFMRMEEVAMRDEFTSAGAVDRVFGGRQIGMIDQIAQYSPEVARTLLARGYAALEAQGAAVDGLIMSHDRQSPGVVLNDRGEITIDFSVLGLNEAQTRRLNEGAAFAYGGSVAEMLRDGGARLAGSEFDDVRRMTRMSVFSGLTDSLDEIMVLTEARTALNRTRAAFGTRLDGMLPEQAATAPETGATAPTTPGETPDGPVGEVPSAEVAYAPYNQIRGYEVFSQDEPFIAAVEQTGSRLGINPEWMLRAMAFETGGDFGTGPQNPQSSATGLIGFMAATARGMGTSVEALAQMDRVEQMEYVERYLEPYADRINNVGDLYMSILYPRAIGEGDDYVLFSEGDGNYGPNANIDRVFGNNDGRVTRGEAVAMMLESSGGGAATPARELPPVQDLPVPTHRDDLIEDMQFGVFVTPGASSLGENATFTMEGASTMTREGADTRIAEILQGPFTEMERIFGARVSILDGIARAGTTRERDTPGSRHFHGDALDLDVASMSNEEKLRLLASAYAAGFRGFGLGEGGLHVDARGYTSSWNYTDTYGGLPIATVQGWLESGEFPEEYADILAGSGGAVRPTGGAGGRGPAAGDAGQEAEDWDGETGQLLTAARMDGGGGGSGSTGEATGGTAPDATVETTDGTSDDSGPVGAAAATQAAQDTAAQAAEAVSVDVLRAADADLPERTMTILRVMNEENAPVAQTLDEAYELISGGVIGVGDTVVINGRVSQVTRQMAANAER